MPPIQVKDFFKTLAEKAQMGEAQEYLKGIRKKMGVESFVQAHEEGLFNNKKFALSNAEKWMHLQMVLRQKPLTV